MSTIVEFVTSNKGKPLLVYDGYIFKKNKSTEKVTYWICQHGACNATVHTDSNDQYLKSRGNHETHLPSPEQIELRNFRDIVKKRTAEETIAIGMIYEEELARANLSQTALAIAPSANEASKFLISSTLAACGVFNRIIIESCSSAKDTEVTFVE
jgi:FLYWCH zinc finger domain